MLKLQQSGVARSAATSEFEPGPDMVLLVWRALTVAFFTVI
jgi:hypothetical protein